MAAYRHAHYLANKGKVLQQTAEYRKSHPEMQRAAVKKWKTNHPDQARDCERKARLKRKDKIREYVKANRPAIRQLQRNWDQRNREKMSQWRKDNRQQQLARAKRWRDANPEKWAAASHRYRAKLYSLPGKFTGDEWKALKEMYSGRCLACGEVKPLTADHIVPVTKGGTNFIQNIQPLCKSCNSTKGTKTIDYRNLYQTAGE